MKISLISKIALMAFILVAVSGVEYASAATLACSPVSATVDVNERITFKATGGTGSYTWNAPNMAAQTGDTITVFYPRSGESFLTVKSGNEVAVCNVDITGNVLGATTLSCGPALRTVLPNQIVNFDATGGTGTYVWTAPGMQSQTGSELNVTYGRPGHSYMILTSGNESVRCNVIIAGTSTTPNVPTTPTIPTTPGLPNTGMGGGAIDLLNLGMILGVSGMAAMTVRKKIA